MTHTFDVTYCKATEESVAAGDFSESGFISQGSSLRHAVKDVRSCDGIHIDHTEASARLDGYGRMVRLYHGEELTTGEREERTLHIPAKVTASSARRIARLLGVSNV